MLQWSVRRATTFCDALSCVCPRTCQATTHGINVHGSYTLVPLSEQFVYVYSFTITADFSDAAEKEGTKTWWQRNESVQLLRRHWDIHNETLGDVETVDGEGVVGLSPVFFPDGQSHFSGVVARNPFVYQSTIQAMGDINMSGYFTFCESPSNTLFRVRVPELRLRACLPF